MIIKEIWGNFSLFTLENEFLRVRVSDLGATLVSLQYKGQERVICYETPEDYLASNDFLGATVGRYANRIAGAAFTLDGKRYTLTANEGRNQLHGGTAGLLHNKRRWEAAIERESLRFSLLSPAGDNGFPGEIKETVRYSLSGATTLRLDFEGECDAATHFAPTNHSYFDLSGHGKCLDAVLQLNADKYLAVDGENIPTAVETVEGTRFDFRQARPIGENYDHCFVLAGEPACVLTDGDCRMTIRTDFPAIQVYTGSGLSGSHRPNAAVALEPEFYPDSPNHPEYPSTVLRPGEVFRKYIEYRFDENDSVFVKNR